MLKTLTQTAIDAVHSSQKIFVDTFVKNEELSKTLKQYVDLQADFVKKTADSTIDVGTKVYTTVTDKKFYEDTLK